MRLDRKFARLAASVLATAMFVCGAALPAMAESEQIQQPGEGQDSISQIVIDKVLQKPDKALAPNYTFTFTIAPAGAANVQEGALLEGETATGNKNDGSSVVLDVYKGVSAAVFSNSTTTDGKAVFAPDASNDTGKMSLTESFTFSINAANFPHAGVYKYTVTEQDSNYDGITNDIATTRDLYVYVENGDTAGQFKVVGAVVKGADNDKTDRFTNTYLTDGTDDNNNELYITKDVQGTLGNLTEEFSFTVSIASNFGTDTANNAEKYYAVFETLINAQENIWATDTSVNDESAGITAGVVTLSAGNSANIKLKDNQRLHIYGLSDNDQYTIVETDANTNGYATRVTGNVQDEDSVSNENAALTVVGTVNPEAATVKNITYINERNSITPTGVLLNVAPYVLMVIIAVAAAFVFLRKRRDD